MHQSVVIYAQEGAWLGGTTILPELLKGHPDHVPALKKAGRVEELTSLELWIAKLLPEQESQ